MDRVKKIELSNDLLLEVLRPFIGEELPKDADIINVWYSPGLQKVGVLVGSSEYNQVNGGDLAFYAPYFETKPVFLAPPTVDPIPTGTGKPKDK